MEGITTINRVGVGEVFLISGQSNARGVIGETAHPINQDDRVSCITNFFANDTDTPPFPTFAQLKDENTFYAPEGYGSWYWGELGAKLATRLNVPILFINTAWEGLAIDAWRESLLGGTAPNPFSGLRAKPGYPYNSTRYALNYYHHLSVWLKTELIAKLKVARDKFSPIFLDIVVDVTKINIQIDMPKSEPQLKKNLLRTMTGSTIKKKNKKRIRLLMNCTNPNILSTLSNSQIILIL